MQSIAELRGFIQITAEFLADIRVVYLKVYALEGHDLKHRSIERRNVGHVELESQFSRGELAVVDPVSRTYFIGKGIVCLEHRLVAVALERDPEPETRIG